MTKGTGTGPRVLLVAGLSWPAAARAEDFYVDAGAAAGGVGTEADPFAEIQDALDVAVAGDVIHVLPGTYAPIATVVDGTGAAPIVVQAEPAGQAIVQGSGTVLAAHHEFHTFQGLVLDGGYGPGDAIDGDGANFMELFDVEVRRAGGDCIDLHTAEGVLVANSRLHHCVAADAGGPVDAHGVTGDSVFNLELRDTEIYLVSGDAVHPSPAGLPWSDLEIRRCTLWSGPLDEDAGPVAAGTVIGGSALQTRVGELLDGNGAPPRVELVDVEAWGFADADRAAFELADAVDVLVDRVTVHDGALAFRVRGSAAVRVQNAVVHTVDAAVRLEDGPSGVAFVASTLGGDVGTAFVDGGGPPVDLQVENLLVLGDVLPDEASGGAANLAVGPEAFVDAANHDYHLVAGSEPIDAGVDLEGVTLDRDGTFRPVGSAPDVGAYEWDGGGPPPPPPGGTDDGETSGDEAATADTGGLDGTSTGETSAADDTGGTGPLATGFDGSGGTVTGCGCRSRAGSSASTWTLLGLLAAWRRRRAPRG